MEQTNFYSAFVATINEAEVAKKGGLSYLAAATAMRLAGRPAVQFVEFNGNEPHLAMLGGAVVAVDLTVPGTDNVQRMWLPVMDRDNMTMALKDMVATDINNSRQRCLVKAIASVYGDGMSLYLGCDGDGPKAAKLLGVNPETDLQEVTPVVATLKEGGAPYIEWGIGLAACRITDPTFFWEVVLWTQADGRELPYREVLGGLMVDVDTVYHGKRQRLSLPVMDAAFNPLGADKATVFDWNKTVMRALTKCIAFNSGYGLGVYADEFGAEKEGAKGAKGRKPGKADAKQDVKVEAQAPAPTPTPAPAPAPAPVEAAAPAPAVDEHASASAASAPDTAVEATAPASAPAPVEAAAPAVADAAEPTPAPAPPASESEAVGRFREVMRKRRDVNGVAGVITLFEALATSTKFAPEDKPGCFAALVTASAAIVDEANIIDLVTALRAHEAMKYLALDTRDMVAAKMTSVMLAAAVAVSDDALVTAAEDLVSAGVAQDANDVMRLAAIGNVPAETVDLLKDVLEQAA